MFLAAIIVENTDFKLFLNCDGVVLEIYFWIRNSKEHSRVWTVNLLHRM